MQMETMDKELRSSRLSEQLNKHYAREEWLREEITEEAGRKSAREGRRRGLT
jgi:hypothetical protein